jgi:hypothetical protein
MPDAIAWTAHYPDGAARGEMAPLTVFRGAIPRVHRWPFSLAAARATARCMSGGTGGQLMLCMHNRRPSRTVGTVRDGPRAARPANQNNV